MSYKDTMQKCSDEYVVRSQAALRRASLANQLLRGMISTCRGGELSAEAADRAQELLQVVMASGREYGRAAIRAVIYATEALADETYCAYWDVAAEDSRNVSRLLMEARYFSDEFLAATKDMADNVIKENRDA